MIEGDFTQLGRIGAGVADLSDVPRLASELVSERLADLVQLEFDAGVDPFGAAWERLADATVDSGRRPPPLTDTRELRDSLLVYPARPAGIRMTIGTESHPAGPHQDGWRGPQGSGPSRPIFPTGGEMPLAWESAIDDATIEAVTAKLAEVRS